MLNLNEFPPLPNNNTPSTSNVIQNQTTRNQIIFTPKNQTYANKLNKVNSKKLSIVFPSYKDIHINQYIRAVGEKIGPNKITHASKISRDRACVVLSDEDTVNAFIDNFGEITVNHTTLKARKMLQTSKRLILSQVYPDISNECLKEALDFLNIKTTSEIETLKLAMDQNDEGYNVYSFRRQVYIHEETKSVPPSIQIDIDGELYRIFLTIDEITCFICKQTGHISSKCKNIPEKSPVKITEIPNDTTSDRIDDDEDVFSDTIDDENNMEYETSTIPENSNVKITEVSTESTIIDKTVQNNNNKRKPPPSSTSSTKSSTTTKTQTKNPPKTPDLQPKKKKKEDHAPFTDILKGIENQFQPGEGISYNQVIEFLEATRKSTKPCEAARNLNLNLPELQTVLRLIHPSLQDKHVKIRFTKIANALREGNQGKINCLADWSTPTLEN